MCNARVPGCCLLERDIPEHTTRERQTEWVEHAHERPLYGMGAATMHANQNTSILLIGNGAIEETSNAMTVVMVAVVVVVVVVRVPTVN